MKRLTVLLFILTYFSSSSVIAGSFDQQALIARAVDATISNFKSGGIPKLTEVSQNCYRGLDLSYGNKNRERDVQYCIAQDNASIKLYNMLSHEDQYRAGNHFATLDDFFMTWIQTTDAVVRITPEQYKFYLTPIIQGAAANMGSKFAQQ